MKKYDIRDIEDNAEFTTFHDLIEISHKRAGVEGSKPEDHLIINLLQEGKAIYRNEKQEVILAVNDITITRPNEKHEVLLSSPNLLNNLIYSPEYINNFLSAMTLPHKALLDDPKKNNTIALPISDTYLKEKWESVELIRKIYQLAQDHSGVDLGAIHDILLHDILLSIVRNEILYQFEKNQKAIPKVNGIQAEISKRVNTAVEYIKDCYHEDLSLEQLANIATMSKFHFARAFKNIKGKTPHQYIQQRRIEKAKYLLSYSDKSITEIGFDIGYNNTTAFYMAFQKEIGMSPSNFRKEYKT